MLREKHKIYLEEKAAEERIEEEKKEVEEKRVKEFNKKLAETDDMTKILNEFCEFLKGKVNATGVYIAIVEQRKKPITDESDDKGHIDPSEPMVMRYIGADDEHKYMLGQTIKIDESFTYQWFTNTSTKANIENPEGENKEEVKEEVEGQVIGEPVEKEEKMLQIRVLSDVLKEPNLKYFKVPRLGCYMAMLMTRKVYLTEELLNTAYAAYADIIKRKEEQEAEKKEKLEEIENTVSEREKKKEETAEAEAEKSLHEPEVEWPEIVEPPYENLETTCYICLDTLGQDREFSAQEKNYIIDTTTYMGKCWEDGERRRLTHDKELCLEIKQSSDELKERKEKELEEQCEKEIEDFLNAEENQEEQKEEGEEEELDEDEKTAKVEEMKYKFLVKSITGGEYYDQLMKLKEFNILKFPRVIQYAFYVLEYDREAICEPETNKLEWERARELFNEEFFKKIEEYTPYGPKEGVYPAYRLLNTLEKGLEEVKEEELAEYSFALVKLLKWIKEVIRTRKADIYARRVKKQEEREEREALFKKKEEHETQRAEELAARLKEEEEKYNAEVEEMKAENEKKDEFEYEDFSEQLQFEADEKELMKDWDEANPLVIIPEEIQDDIDNDYIGDIAPPPESS